MREAFEEVTCNDLLVVCRASNKLVTFKSLDFLVANTGHHVLSDEAVESQLVSDEAVESIGREDYVLIVACLGQYTTDGCFWEKTSGLA